MRRAQRIGDLHRNFQRLFDRQWHFGPYEIHSALGAGGMGEVYKVSDTRLDHSVAIKILPEILAADPQFVKRFNRDARAIAQLTHPAHLHVVRRR